MATKDNYKIKECKDMEIPEMLDNLKQKALGDKKLRKELLDTRKEAQPCLLYTSRCV